MELENKDQRIKKLNIIFLTFGFVLEKMFNSNISFVLAFYIKLTLVFNTNLTYNSEKGEHWFSNTKIIQNKHWLCIRKNVQFQY